MPTLVKTRRKPAGKPSKEANFWAIRYRCPFRKRSWVISTFCKSKVNAERRLREFCSIAERGELSLDNPFKLQRQTLAEQHARLKIENCLVAFETDLRAGRIRSRGKRTPVGAEHAQTTMNRLRKIFTAIGITNARMLTVETINTHLDAQTMSLQSRKHMERVVKSFSRFLFVTDRLDKDPLARLVVTCVNADDVIRNRIPFTLEQANAIIAAAAVSDAFEGGLTGRQRAVMYAFASATGFRYSECCAVRRCFFTKDFSFVSLGGKFTKNKTAAYQPIPAELRPILASFCADLSPEAMLWPVDARTGADFLRVDAADAGIVIGLGGKDINSGVLDFHSWRHFYISGLERAGLSESVRKRLARASGGIVEHYTHRDEGQIAAAGAAVLVPDVSVLAV